MILVIIILSISLSLDAFGVGIVYGLRKTHVPALSRIIICAFSIFYSGAALLIGKGLSSILPHQAAKWIGIGVLTAMGIWIILQGVLDEGKKAKAGPEIPAVDQTLFKIAIKSLGISIQVIRHPTDGDIDKSGVIDVFESLLLGLALSIDAIGVGIGSGLAGFSSLFIPLFSGLFQMLFLSTGLYLGKRFSATGWVNEKVMSMLPGLLLICLALARLKFA